MNTKHFLFLALVLVRSLFAVEALNFDFDDNIMVTPARIMAYDQVNRREVPVSTADWALVKNALGKPGDWLHFSLQPEGLRFFGDEGPRGTEEFRAQLAQALTGTTYRGPRWQAFADALGDSQRRPWVAIITARLHSPDSMLHGLELLKERGLIPALPEKRNIYAVLWPGFPSRYKGATSADSKANVMRDLLDRLEKTPGRHTWNFSDDDFDNFEKAQLALEPEVKAGRWPHVEVSLTFTGTNHPGKQPYTTVLGK